MKFPYHFVAATTELTTYEKHIPAPIFRHRFDLECIPEKAGISILTPGFYELWVNGRKITKGLLAPYISNPDDLIYYDTYDATPYLKEGENVIGVMLGNGFQNLITSVWDFEHARHNAPPAFAFEFISDEISFTAKDFLHSESEITFNNYRSGIHVDARKKQEGWQLPAFDDSLWQPVIKAAMPRGQVKECRVEPILVRQEIKPVSVTPGSLVPLIPRGDVKERYRDAKLVEDPPETEGGYIYDFGINTAGIFRLKIKGSPGQKISLQFAERLTDGKVDPTNISFFYPDGYGQRDIYICSGEGEEVFEPPFVYHGYRYVYVSGITEEQAGPDLLTYLEAHSDLKDRATLKTSSEVVNRLWEITRRSDLSNFHYFPTDCPHREKNGWTGDASMSAEHMIFTLGVETSWSQWMESIRRAQLEDGMLPGIVPTTGWGYAWGNGPAWDSVIFTLPYYTYVYRGDLDMARDTADSMLRYLSYISKERDERGIVAIGLGDWCPVGRDADEYKVPLGITDSIMVMDCAHKAAVLFEKLGLSLHLSFAKQLESEMRRAIRENYLDTSTMLLEGNCQSAQAMGLYYHVFDSAERELAFKRLLEIIERDGRNMDVGFLGGRVLFHVLSDFGYSELAFHMITKKDYPSYGNLLERGATSLWEMFVPEGERSGSENHHFWGDINHWFLRHLAGINVNPKLKNPNEIVLTPRFIDALDYVEASYEAVNGVLEVKWERKDGKIFLTAKADDKLDLRINLENGYVFADDGLSYRNGNLEGLEIK